METYIDTSVGNPNTLSDCQPSRELTLFDIWKRDVLDEINERNCQEITITFKPRWISCSMYWLKDLVERNLKDILAKGVKHSVVILMYELSNTGMFHYHGILSDISAERLREIKRIFNTHIGRTEIKQIRYMDSYLKYMYKRYDTDLHLYEMIDSKLDIDIIRNSKRRRAGASAPAPPTPKTIDEYF